MPENGIAPAVDILIAEDDAPTRWALRRLLEGEGYTIAEAADGREAVELTLYYKPDVVLVEFYDYACPYCKASNPHVEQLIKEDPGLRVVYRRCALRARRTRRSCCRRRCSGSHRRRD